MRAIETVGQERGVHAASPPDGDPAPREAV